MNCIAGAIMYCATALYVQGPIGHAPSVTTAAWSYAAAYSVPLLAPRPMGFPGEFPILRRS
jgi:hypothetical protein